jgi:hypothetical protein
MCVAVGVAMGMCVRVAMLLTMVVARTMFMLMLMLMTMFVIVIMRVLVLVVMSAYPYRALPGQSTAAIFTHYSISKEASSISLPARKSPLGWWHLGQSPNMSSD